MPSRDAATSTLVLPRAAARPAAPAGPERSAPPPNRVSADSGTSTPISNPVFPVSSPLGRPLGTRARGRWVDGRRARWRRRRAHRGSPVTTRPTPAAPPVPPPKPVPVPPLPPKPPLPPPLPGFVAQVTSCGSQEKVGVGDGLPLSFPLPFWPLSCFLCFLATLRRFGGTWFQVWPVKTVAGNGSTSSGTHWSSASACQ